MMKVLLSHKENNAAILAAYIAQQDAYHDDRQSPIMYQEALNRATHQIQEQLQKKTG